MRMPLPRFISLLLGWCYSHFPRTEEGHAERERWLYDLDVPLPGETAVRELTQADAQADKDAFMALMKG